MKGVMPLQQKNNNFQKVNKNNKNQKNNKKEIIKEKEEVKEAVIEEEVDSKDETVEQETKEIIEESRLMRNRSLHGQGYPFLFRIARQHGHVHDIPDFYDIHGIFDEPVRKL